MLLCSFCVVVSHTYIHFFDPRAASVFPAAFMIAATYAGCYHLLVVIYFIISIGAQGFITCGTMINPMDLSPNYASAISSLTNASGSLTGVVAPYVVGIMTPNVSSQLSHNHATRNAIINRHSFQFAVVAARMAPGVRDHRCRPNHADRDFHIHGHGQNASVELPRKGIAGQPNEKPESEPKGHHRNDSLRTLLSHISLPAHMSRPPPYGAIRSVFAFSSRMRRAQQQPKSIPKCHIFYLFE